MTDNKLLSCNIQASRSADLRRLELRRPGQDQPLLAQRAPADARPSIHPLLAPDGLGELTEDSPPHHPWQHGLYTGMHAVGGSDFWTEGGKRADEGRFACDAIDAPQAVGDALCWQVHARWSAHDGTDLLRETQRWALIDRGAYYLLELDWRLAAPRDLEIGAHAYGGLFLRMPYRGEGRALSSEGLRDGDAEQQRARWVDVAMPIPGREGWAGITIMDHPDNPEHPSPWRVDGQLGIGPSRSIAGDWRIRVDEPARFRYRLLAHAGAGDVAQIDALWQEFAESEEHPHA